MICLQVPQSPQLIGQLVSSDNTKSPWIIQPLNTIYLEKFHIPRCVHHHDLNSMLSSTDITNILGPIPSRLCNPTPRVRNLEFETVLKPESRNSLSVMCQIELLHTTCIITCITKLTESVMSRCQSLCHGSQDVFEENYVLSTLVPVSHTSSSYTYYWQDSELVLKIQWK